ncbi:TrmB family transcriptional regulator [Halomicrobium salinisoli]|uniref:TrmB family transcriptional regulator n=1 Tax=Halomicrobium salinisoli TaxID=2878391 RepID=UPI001CF0A032|nr:TrmB family transcriptional regulator [Halomicrobium salinisoli]
MNDDELIAVLEDAGLSPYQAETYVTLLDLGNASATDVADACDVPDPRIYDVLRDLESKGYIETYQQDTLTARAHDPEEVLDDLRSRSNRYLTAAEDIEDRWNQPALAEHEVSVVKRFDTVLSRAREVIGEAENQIQLSVTADQFELLADDLEAARDRGVYVKLSISSRAGRDALPDEETLAATCTEARYRDVPSTFLVLVDRNWTCFAPHEQSVNEYGVLVSDRAHAYVFHWFFRTCLWEIWETIYTERTADTPRTYVDLRACIRDIQPLVESGTTVRATVTGRDTETNAERTVSGEITGIEYSGESTEDDTLPLAELAGRASVTVDTGSGTVSVGGWGAVIEEIEATSVIVTDVE